MRQLSRQILTFVLLVLAFSSVPYALMIHTGHLMAGEGLGVVFVMWCPTLAALATCALFRIDVSTLGWDWRPAKYEALAYFLPILYALPVYLACWIAVKGSFVFDTAAQQIATSYGMAGAPRLATLGIGIPLIATIGMVGSLATALGEEIGWRGFLLPRLTGRFGFTAGCLVSGAIWAAWHYPLLLGADYNAGTNPRYALPCFTIMVIAMAFPLGWLRLKSGSLWPCAMLHASHNLFVQAIFDRMTATTGRAPYITTEFGAGLALTITATAVFFWIRRPANVREAEPAHVLETA